MASWADDIERSAAYDEQLRSEPGFVPDPKPARRVKADQAAWRRLRERVLEQHHACCQICHEPWYTRGLTAHHLVPRSQGGDDVPENLAVLCGHGTVGCHGDVEARRNGARARLRIAMSADQTQYVLEKKGMVWLDRHYGEQA